jgi:hypothetical protein
MPEGSFSIKDLAIVIARTLGLAEGDSVELKRDRLNPNRVLVVRIPQEESVPNVQGSSQEV